MCNWCDHRLILCYKKNKQKNTSMDRNGVIAPLLQFLVVTHLYLATCTLVEPYSNSPAFSLVVSTKIPIFLRTVPFPCIL